MHVRGQPHFGNESDASTGNAYGIGLFEGQLKMRGFDRVRYFLAQFREQLGNNTISGKPLSVFRFEELFSNVFESGSASMGYSSLCRSAKYFRISSES